jgi:hypothetical protein
VAFRTASSRPEGHGSGPGVRLRHPAGLLAEYLEHRPSADADEPEPVFRWPQRSPPEAMRDNLSAGSREPWHRLVSHR